MFQDYYLVKVSVNCLSILLKLCYSPDEIQVTQIHTTFYLTALDEAVKTFNEAKKVVTSKTYDYLNQKDDEFDHDYDEFINKTEALKDHIGSTIEETFADIWETRHGYKFLIRFEKVSFEI